MEFIPLFVGFASGVAVGWFGHQLARRRSKEDIRRSEEIRAINDTIELVEAFTGLKIHETWSSRHYEDQARKRYEKATQSTYADVDLIPDSESWAKLAEFVNQPLSVGSASDWIDQVNKYKQAVVRSLKERRRALTA